MSMASLWPDAFDAEGNKTDWKYDPSLEVLTSPSTGDFMYRTDSSPPVADQIAWVESHPDAIRMAKP
jgi:hypothetical protein